MDSIPRLEPNKILPVSSAFQIEIDKHIRFVDPKRFKTANEKPLLIKDYFITSGDAVQKLTIFIQHVKAAIKRNKNAYGKALGKVLIDANSLMKAFLKIRGPHCFLETEWESHRLLCVPKDPRRREEDVSEPKAE
jgi:hypothetical protein